MMKKMLITICAALGFAASAFCENVVFKNGDEGYAVYRIPSIVRVADDSVLAFAEARLNGPRDAGRIDLVMKRSTDGGKTWSPMQVVASDGANTCGNPVPILDKKSKDIVLLYCWNLATDHEGAIINRKSKDTRRVFMKRSKDNGLTWSDSVEITKQVKPENASGYATGPGGGIQLEGGKHDGRMLVPFNMFTYPQTKNFAGVLISDDGGRTWRVGGTGACTFGNESQVAQLGGDSLVLNSRCHQHNRWIKSRVVSFSDDGGESWFGDVHDTALPEPMCEAGLLSVKTPKGRALVFSNPADTEKRVNLVVRFTPAERYLKWYKSGCPRTPPSNHWQVSKTVYPKSVGYSDMELLPNGKIGVLFEKDGISKIVLEELEIPAL